MPNRGRRVPACLCADWHAQSLRCEQAEALTIGDSAPSVVTRDAERLLRPDGPARAPSGPRLRSGAFLALESRDRTRSAQVRVSTAGVKPPLRLPRWSGRLGPERRER